MKVQYADGPPRSVELRQVPGDGWTMSVLYVEGKPVGTKDAIIGRLKLAEATPEEIRALRQAGYILPRVGEPPPPDRFAGLKP